MYDDPDENPNIIYLPPQEDEAPYWTLRRMIYLIVAIILIVALLATLLWPLLWQIANPPPPTPTPSLPTVWLWPLL